MADYGETEEKKRPNEGRKRTKLDRNIKLETKN